MADTGEFNFSELLDNLYTTKRQFLTIEAINRRVTEKQKELRLKTYNKISKNRQARDEKEMAQTYSTH